MGFNHLFVSSLQAVPHADRQAISRLRNCVAALAQCKMMIYDTSIMYTYDASVKLGLNVNNFNHRFIISFLFCQINSFGTPPQVKDLLLPDRIAEVALMVRKQFEMEKE